MTRRLTFGILTVAMITCLTLSFSNTQIVRAESKHPHEHDLLEKSMKTMSSAFKAIRRQTRTKSFGVSTLKQIEKMQTAALIAMHQSDDDFANNKQMVIEYRSRMANAIKKMLNIELALLKGDKDDVVTMINELNAIMKDGHSKFRDDG